MSLGYGTQTLACPEQVIRRHLPMAQAIARCYFAPGLEHEDLLQEALIGLCEAHRDYQPGTAATFTGFARTCIERQVITAVITARRGKHRPLNDSASLDEPLAGEHTTLGELIPGPWREPHQILAEREQLREIVQLVRRRFTDTERRALITLINGTSYSGDKQTDNALQRARVKLAEAA